jgi:Cu+-exporting ATPase
MDSLIAIGSTAAFLYGIAIIYSLGFAISSGNDETIHKYVHDLYFESSATILTLVTLGKYLESRSKSKTTDAITKLINLAPKTAILLKGDKEVEVPVENLKKGDIIVLKPGASAPVDGVVINGSSYFDESALTGESMPVFRQTGDKILSASINQSGYVQVQSTSVGDETTLARIINLVEEASSSKAPISRLADKISSIFVPIVILISIVTAVVWISMGYPFDFAFSAAISVLVISCPCALGLATPVAIMVGTGKGAETGILFKSAESIEKLGKIDTVVLDKTGTVTTGDPVVSKIYNTGQLSDKEILRICSSIEKLSEHPISKAIIKKATSEDIIMSEVTDFNSTPGKGVEGKIGNTRYFAGNQDYIQENLSDLRKELLDFTNEISQKGMTPVFLADENSVTGIFAISDTVKPGSSEAIAQIKDSGAIVYMLTGDKKAAALEIAKEIGVENVISDVLPGEKANNIKMLQDKDHIVAMVGDGINDAPALATADVGIAIGAGTDIAVESADIILMKSNIMDVANAMRLGKSVMNNIKQNLFWAFFYNILCIPLAAGVFYGLFGLKLSPSIAAAAMSISSVTVVLNALRLRFFKPIPTNHG